VHKAWATSPTSSGRPRIQPHQAERRQLSCQMIRTSVCFLLLESWGAALRVITTHRVAPPSLTTTARTVQLSMAEMKTVDDSSYQELVIARSHTIPVLVDFFADWCAPCKRVWPLLAALHDAGEVIVVKADLSTPVFQKQTSGLRDMIQEQDQKLEVQRMPTLILFQDGMPQDILVGKFSAAKLDAFVADAVASVRGVVTPRTPTRPALGGLAASQLVATVVPTKPVEDLARRAGCYEHEDTQHIVCRGGVCRVVLDEPAHGKPRVARSKSAHGHKCRVERGGPAHGNKCRVVRDGRRRMANNGVARELSAAPHLAGLAASLSSAVSARSIKMDVCDVHYDA